MTCVLLGWVLKWIAVDGFGFAKFIALEKTIKFASREYQKIFDAKNPAPFRGAARSTLGV